MAKKKWITVSGGGIKCWKRSERGCCYGYGVPPHWYRNCLNRRERRKSRQAILKGEAHCFPYIHPSTANWYW